ncbi:MAG: hypothetical protein JWN03_3692 [Nocardia sp.]|uniref:hypothetical protein n=1 Tax=Nocardia sp. TaxID=1821 RepID=UPI0026354F5D|nr:hypothetical protein [Nocardia sp.]MCU1643417.1 hypothetical protein [Nocardia sp.]
MSDTNNNRPVTYAMRWDPNTLRPDQVMTDIDARWRNQRGFHYAVVLGDVEHPEVVLDIDWRKQLLITYFLDEFSRLRLKYQFQKIDDESLFMTTSTLFMYQGSAHAPADSAYLVDQWQYLPTGRGHRELWEDGKGLTEVDFDEADIALCWEPTPTFGAWTSISRMDRTQPLWTPPPPRR